MMLPAVNKLSSNDRAEFAGVVRMRSARGHSRLPPPELPVEYTDHAARLQRLSKAAAIEEEERRAAAQAIADSKSKPSSRKPPGPPRSHDQVVSLAGVLSSASNCATLLAGQLKPKEFAETVASMESREEMARWVGAFGTCVARLGGTLQDLHGRLNRLLRSKKRSRLQTATRHVLTQATNLEEAIDALDATARLQVRQTTDHYISKMKAASHDLCFKPVRRDRLWTRALVAGLQGVEADARKQRVAMRAIADSTGSLKEAAAAICTQACQLLGCEEACLYVAVYGRTANGLATSQETLYRLLSATATPEEVNACEYEMHGTVAAEVSAASLAGACLSQPKALMRVDRGHSDPRYEPSADRIPGQPEPASLLYLDLSDPGGPLRAVLRCAHHVGAREEHFAARVERALADLLPLFQLALRHPARAVAADTVTAHRATAMRSIGACVECMARMGREADLGGILGAFSHQAAALLDAEGCVIYVLDQAHLVALPPDAADEPTMLDVDGEADTKGSPLPNGLVGLCAASRQLISVADATADARVNPDVDIAAGCSRPIRSLLVMPLISVSSGALTGVCEVLNKRSGDGADGGGFSDEDETLMYSLLKVVSLAIENWQTRADIERIQGRVRRS